jgi:hypothetical protein
MQLPIVAPAPVVTAHADAFRDLFENRCQFQHFQHYLTGAWMHLWYTCLCGLCATHQFTAKRNDNVCR